MKSIGNFRNQNSSLLSSAHSLLGGNAHGWPDCRQRICWWREIQNQGHVQQSQWPVISIYNELNQPCPPLGESSKGRLPESSLSNGQPWRTASTCNSFVPLILLLLLGSMQMSFSSSPPINKIDKCCVLVECLLKVNWKQVYWEKMRK